MKINGNDIRPGNVIQHKKRTVVGRQNSGGKNREKAVRLRR